MEIVLVVQQRVDFVLESRGNEFRLGEQFFQIGNDIVALDMDRAIMNEHRQ